MKRRDLSRVGFRDNDEMMAEIELVEYDPSWRAAFERMASKLRERFGERLILHIEHIGSTAIPGMPAKPVIDMLVAVPSFEAARNGTVQPLLAEGWQYFWRDDRPPGHMMFIRCAEPGGPRTHHVHMAPADHPTLWRRVAFRDYMIAHPEEASRYAALKRELALHHADDREAYTNAKGVYVKRITERAHAVREQ